MYVRKILQNFRSCLYLFPKCYRRVEDEGTGQQAASNNTWKGPSPKEWPSFFARLAGIILEHHVAEERTIETHCSKFESDSWIKRRSQLTYLVWVNGK